MGERGENRGSQINSEEEEEEVETAAAAMRAKWGATMVLELEVMCLLALTAQCDHHATTEDIFSMGQNLLH